MTADSVADKFKEVLERKNAQNKRGSAHLDGGENKPQTPHGPESHQQQFRRKSV